MYTPKTELNAKSRVSIEAIMYRSYRIPTEEKKTDDLNVPNQKFQMRHHQKIRVSKFDVFFATNLFSTNLDDLRPPMISHDRTIDV